MFRMVAIAGAAFFATLANAFPNCPTAFAPFFTAFRPAITTVVIIPAIEIATADTPAVFSYINLSNLVRSLVLASFCIIDSASSDSGRKPAFTSMYDFLAIHNSFDVLYNSFLVGSCSRCSKSF